MPLYHYRVLKPPCRLCGEGHECVHSASEPARTECHKCGLPVERVGITSANTPRLLKPLSVTDAKSAGFTVLKRVGRGEYERQ